MAHIWGPRSDLGLGTAIVAFLGDLLSKFYLIDYLHGRFPSRFTVAPFFDLVLSWNRGISYGMLASDHWIAQPVLISVGLMVLLGLWIWLARARGWLLPVGLGLVIGGATGNLWDRIHYGAVADFFSFHAWGYYWYVFNLADVWIVLGGGVLIWQTLMGEDRRDDAGA